MSRGAAARAAWLCAAALGLGAGSGAAADSTGLPEHRRLVAPEGVVHVWRPPEYHPADAGIVVYVHGPHADVDEVWTLHGLAEQFAESRENALFIVPDAPFSWDEPVASWCRTAAASGRSSAGSPTGACAT